MIEEKLKIKINEIKKKKRKLIKLFNTRSKKQKSRGFTMLRLVHFKYIECIMYVLYYYQYNFSILIMIYMPTRELNARF